MVFISPVAQELPFRKYAIYEVADLVVRFDLREDTQPIAVIPNIEPTHQVEHSAGIAFLSDQGYESQAQALGVPGYQLQTVLINNINGIYQRQFGLSFHVTRFIRDHRSNVLTSNDPRVLITQMEDPIRSVIGDLRQVAVRVATGTEIAHFTTARDLTGSIVGIGNLPGVYSLAQQIPLLNLFISTSYHDMILSAHEIGHNFNAVHEEADQWCDAEFLGICFDTDQTIMWPELGDNQPYYSDGTRDSGHNNRNLIAVNMARGRSQDF